MNQVTPARQGALAPAQIKVILLGDIHDAFTDDDERHYPGCGADLILWTGDLGHLEKTDRLCQRLVALHPRCFGVLGNHDGASMPHVIAEALGQDLIARPFATRHCQRVRGLIETLDGRHLGFSGVDLDELGLSVVGMRPHSTGGQRMHFPVALREVYGVDDVPAQHVRNIDSRRFDDLIFIGHNGPRGLGALPTSPFGVDFRAGGGDLGDPDYADALGYARSQGKRVLLAIGGHMHDKLHPRSRHLGVREVFGVLDGVPVINACIVPRVRGRGKAAPRHQHTECVLDRAAMTLRIERVVWTPNDGEVERAQVYDGPLQP